MKKVLITGKNGFVGKELEIFLGTYNGEYQVDFLSVRDEDWRSKDFSIYHAVIHLAGIAHVSRNKSEKDLYYRVNSDLTFELAKKSKEENVEKFIFMSSIIVFGNAKVIKENTVPIPSDFYGNSKLKAEKLIITLSDDTFKISIIRSPLIYGNNVKGNFNRLLKLSRITPFFPDYENKRSIIYVENLCNLIKKCIDEDYIGTIHAQNNEYISTSNLVFEMAKYKNRNMKRFKWFNPVINFLVPRNIYFKKIFGDFYYSIDTTRNDYNLYSFENSFEKMMEVKTENE